MPAAVKRAAEPSVPVASTPVSEPLNLRRFALADLSELGAWLLWRLRDRYPHIEERSFAGWLRTLIDSNEHLFVRSRHAVALAQIIHRPLEVYPVIDELFVLAKGRDSDGVIEKAALYEAAEMYDEFKRWATMLGASEIVIERFTDVPRDMIKERLGRCWVRETTYTKVGA